MEILISVMEEDRMEVKENQGGNFKSEGFSGKILPWGSFKLEVIIRRASKIKLLT